MNLRSRFIVIFVLLAIMALYMNVHRDLVVPLHRSFGEFPASVAGWRMAGQSTLSQDVIKMLRPTEYLSRRYVAEDGTAVDLYLSYFDGGRNSGGIHSPKNCMPGSGWTELSTRRSSMDMGGETLKLVQAVYAMGQHREVINYWFAMRGQTMSDEYSLKLSEITGSMFHNRRDQSFIRISVHAKDNVDAAQKRIEVFLQDFYPVIRDFLPR